MELERGHVDLQDLPIFAAAALEPRSLVWPLLTDLERGGQGRQPREGSLRTAPAAPAGGLH